MCNPTTQLTNEQTLIKESSVENTLKSLIEVTEPYYVLKNLTIDEDNVLKAYVQKQLFCEHEEKGMSYSEAGRHLAILGSLALANSNPVKEKHYYLATKAHVVRTLQEPYDDVTHIGYMKTVSFNRKKAIAEGYLTTENGTKAYTIKVEYQVLTNALFQRMFKQHEQETPYLENYNPYKDSIALFDLIQSEKQCSATLGTIDKKICVGHFDDYPALPVARIAQILTSIANIQNQKIKNNLKPLRIKRVILYAESFLFAGETMRIESQYEGIDANYSNEYIIDTFAYKNTNNIHSARLTCWI